MAEKLTAQQIHRPTEGNTPIRRHGRRVQFRNDEGDTPPPPVMSGDLPSIHSSAFSPHPVVLTLKREDGPTHLDLTNVLTVTQRWHEAILSKSNDLPPRIRELLSGYSTKGPPLDGPHLAFIPMASTGHPHADGRLLGMGLTLPAELESSQRRLALKAITRVNRLVLGSLGAWKVTADSNPAPTENLCPRLWTAHPKGATHWSTVTPIAFDRHPKIKDPAKYQLGIANMVANACSRIGLPKPREVIIAPASAHPDVPPSFNFPCMRRKDGSQRRHSHAILVFDEPVCGPVLIGAGRFRGYGVFRPIPGQKGYVGC